MPEETAAPFISKWNRQVASGPVMALASVGGDPDAGVLDDVAHLQHAGAQALTHQTAYTVLAVAHHGKAHHLGAAARHGGTAGRRPVRPSAAQMAAEEMGRVRATPTITDTRMPMISGACSVAHIIRVPTWLAAAPMGGGDEHGQTDAHKDGHQRGDQDVHLGLLAHGLAQFSGHDGNDQHGQRAAGPPRALAE